ncbi:hypothetical protein E2C01_070772 [Portunus trituberculatus]|uniref:Uncharacterized protein n=1 Tax=Portunus trituberculatus TaxID=210409 RepID=A0A5B7HY81_PORTR|nr:hypothetical protein [Portunus trituberculatus]
MKVSPVVWPPAPREAAKVRKIPKSSKYFKFYSKFSAAFDTDRVLKRAVCDSLPSQKPAHSQRNPTSAIFSTLGHIARPRHCCHS